MGTRFSLEMLATEDDTSTAARRVTKVMDLLWNGGSWRRVSITRPSGKEEQLYINRDSSLSEDICAKGLKLLQRILDDVHTEEEFITNKRLKKITCNWEKVVVISWNLATKKPEVNWELDECRKLGIDTNKITARWIEEMEASRKPRG